MAIELAPNLPSPYISLANFYMRQQVMDKAKSQYAAALEKEPNNLSAHMYLGMIYEIEKNFVKAKESYEKALSISPNFPPAANNLSYIYAERGGNLDLALNLAQKAKEQVPDDPHISDTLGWIYCKKNVPSRAVAYLKEAAEKVPTHPLIRYHLGMAYHKNGNRDLAKKELNEALKIDPKFQGADEARKVLDALK